MLERLHIFDYACLVPEFLVGLGASQRGSEEEKLKLAFQMFDADGSGYITNSEMHALVRVSVMECSPGSSA